VLPAANPLYGWSGFGQDVRLIDGVAEIPVSVSSFKYWKTPFAGGTYFRLFPLWMILKLFTFETQRGAPLVGYFHPQDIDSFFPDLKYKGYGAIYNFLLNFGKRSVFKKLDYLFSNGFQAVTYCEYLERDSLFPDESISR
jgi:hypothetical protein